MNIAVVITPVIWAAEEDYDEGNAPSIYLNASMFSANHSWSSFIYRRIEYKFFLNESLQTAFPDNVLISKFQMNAAKLNSPSESSSEERGGVSRAH